MQNKDLVLLYREVINTSRTIAFMLVLYKSLVGGRRGVVPVIMVTSSAPIVVIWIQFE